MSTTDPGHHHQSIIIVRRGGGHEDGHHGGAWKIAFADFMTAMMAFFLVMWLTSVSDQSTKKQIAQYFNPIELNSDVPPTDGLTKTDNAPKAPPEAATGPNSQPGQPGGKPVGGSAEGGEDQALFRDPYAVLAEIVAEGGPAVEKGTAKGKPDGSGLPGLNGGDAYRDPFDPSSWQLQPNMVASASDLSDKPLSENLPPASADEFKTVASTNTPPPSTKPQTAQDIDAAKLQKEIAASAPDAAAAADVAVKAGSPGSGTVTISLADTLDTGMFQIGSARPTADAIRLMEKIAAILKDRPGEIVIRGHTDARPYAGKSGELDNWRLSTDRAHMAYYMLMRGGLDDKRVEAIEGVADRQPSNPSDPEAASNRRIEILLKEPKA
ncbi:flagellar motor protein MotB [Aureimonas ureilytica]|uniref:flagellar motor protein MotB n=1 Tax=Aureimonas ureilytica TaxID=401562 RepID=UPI00036CB998|nr:flagellar motor protein MotB [Aureimonas ureilytica]